MHHYGLSLSDIDGLIATPPLAETGFGRRAAVVSRPAYGLLRVDLRAGAGTDLELPPGHAGTLFVESGEVVAGGVGAGAHQLLPLSNAAACRLEAGGDSVVYIYHGPGAASASPGLAANPFDYRDKYWGNIQTLVNEEYTGKRLFFRKGQHSSLHFHCQKTEDYYIHSGKLLMRLRAGRGEDRLIELKAGDSFLIPPGLMHQDGGLEDTVIIEVSTHDEDSDSFIVEDGSRHPMPGLPR